MTSPNTGISLRLCAVTFATLNGCLLLACTSPSGPAATEAIATSAPATPAATAVSTAAALATPTTPAVTAAPTPAVTVAASPTVEPAASFGPDTDLASLMPTEIAGHTMIIEPASDPAWSLLNLWNDEQIGRELLDSLGKSEGDIDVVFSYTDAAVPQIIVNAYRVAGADAEALKDGMVANYFAIFEQAGAVVTDTTLGGKDVTVLSDGSGTPGVGEHYYAIGDIVFNVSADPPEWVDDALSALP